MSNLSDYLISKIQSKHSSENLCCKSINCCCHLSFKCDAHSNPIRSSVVYFLGVGRFDSFYNPFCRAKCVRVCVCVLEFNLIFNGFCFVNGCVKVTAKMECMFNTRTHINSVIKKGVVVAKSIINGFCMTIIFHCDRTHFVASNIFLYAMSLSLWIALLASIPHISSAFILHFVLFDFIWLYFAREFS